MTKKSLFKISLLLSVACFSCSTPKVALTPCTVDYSEGKVLCSYGGEEATAIEFKDADDMKCFRPSDFEQYLISCKKGEEYQGSVCRFQSGKYNCSGWSNSMICFTDSDIERLKTRCN